MSTGAECYFVEKTPGNWFYAMQRWPYGDSDEYDKHGPFPTITAAINHMDNNYANPGGWSQHEHRDHVHNGVKIFDEWDKTYTWECCGNEVEG